MARPSKLCIKSTISSMMEVTFKAIFKWCNNNTIRQFNHTTCSQEMVSKLRLQTVVYSTQEGTNILTRINPVKKTSLLLSSSWPRFNARNEGKSAKWVETGSPRNFILSKWSSLKTFWRRLTCIFSWSIKFCCKTTYIQISKRRRSKRLSLQRLPWLMSNFLKTKSKNTSAIESAVSSMTLLPRRRNFWSTLTFQVMKFHG